MNNKILQRSAYGTKLRFPGYNKAWKTAQLGDVCKIVSERLDPKNDSSVRCIELEHIEACTGRLLGTTTTAEIVSLKAVFRPGDVLFGKLRPYLKKFYMPSFTGVCSTEIWVLRPTNCVIDAAFLFCIIQSSLVQRSANATFGTKMPRADWDVVSATPIRFPELDEQSRISGLHQSLNQTTEYLDRLIAAKREQKRGLMQQLLTGKLRFPGFTEPWKTVRIDQLGVVKSGGTPSTDTPEYWGGVHSWCTPTDVTALNTRYLKKTTRTISDSGVKFSAAELLPPQSVIVCTRATVGIAAINTIPMATNQGFKSIIPGLDVDTDFLYYAIMFVKRELLRRAAGSTFLEVSLTSFREIPILWPSSLNEQKRVSRFLGALDHEIELLAQQRAAFAAQRRGLMEKLLSGEIDIQNPKETAA